MALTASNWRRCSLCNLDRCRLALPAAQDALLWLAMRVTIIATALAALGAHGARILQSNDDGWAELYIRSFHEALNDAGHDVVLSAPAEDKSGSGK
jgi:hypothetical protein